MSTSEAKKCALNFLFFVSFTSSGIMWVGSRIFVAFFLIPVLAANRQLMPQVMVGATTAHWLSTCALASVSHKGRNAV
jgi:membrane protein YqaA with SNARE-associated domain